MKSKRKRKREKEYSWYVIVDSREQKPWKFSNSKTKGLTTGDYSIEGCEDKIAVERKSVSDAISSVTSNRKRFEKEWVRAKSLDYFAVVIEGSFRDIYRAVGVQNKINEKKGKSRRKLSAESVIATYIKWQVKYPWVHVFFTGGRSEAKGIVRRIFEGYLRYLTEGYFDGGSWGFG
ncbi:MAG: ERCC4 domain-containing protein [Candidatus Aenigmatarchaeota archaeon]